MLFRSTGIAVAHLDFITAPEEEQHYVHCAECIPQFSSNGQLRQLAKFKRSEFLSHYESDHYGSSVLSGVQNEIATGSRILENYILYLMCKLTDLRLKPTKLKQMQEREIKYNTATTKTFGLFKPELNETPTWGQGPRADMLRGGDLDRVRSELTGLRRLELEKISATVTEDHNEKIEENESNEAKAVSSSENKSIPKKRKGSENIPEDKSDESSDEYEIPCRAKLPLMSEQDLESISSKLNAEVEPDDDDCESLLGI